MILYVSLWDMYWVLQHLGVGSRYLCTQCDPLLPVVPTAATDAQLDAHLAKLQDVGHMCRIMKRCTMMRGILLAASDCDDDAARQLFALGLLNALRAATFRGRYWARVRAGRLLHAFGGLELPLDMHEYIAGFVYATLEDDDSTKYLYT